MQCAMMPHGFDFPTENLIGWEGNAVGIPNPCGNIKKAKNTV